jgi:hypothetical protein
VSLAEKERLAAEYFPHLLPRFGVLAVEAVLDAQRVQSMTIFLPAGVRYHTITLRITC